MLSGIPVLGPQEIPIQQYQYDCLNEILPRGGGELAPQYQGQLMVAESAFGSFLSKDENFNLHITYIPIQEMHHLGSLQHDAPTSKCEVGGA